MSAEEHTKKENKEQGKGTPKPVNRWTNISSDEDESGSEHSDKQQPQPTVTKPTETKPEIAQPEKEEPKRIEQNIRAFDPKKKFRGDRGPMKTVKGGFKAEKLEHKKFQLDTIKNPFAVQVQSSEDEQAQKQVETKQKPAEEPTIAVEKPVEQVKETEQKPKNTKKSKKQQEKEELQELLKELGTEETKPEGEGKKKKKKNKPKKAEEEETKEQPKAEEVQTEKVQQFAVDREQIQQVMKKKAAEAAKAGGPKKVSGKNAVAANAKKAIVERENKNKAKKVYVDL